ncbi:response regulator [Kamptonema animale CS-326]|jgi:two-component system NtrC family sensor kinase|uniref:sensor histidine kinase n=1 Tax=Kamptonema animale TaxID=92934 RepID=UPI00232B1DF2|nr:response regulator [Kamptonema animale]MDB9511805.1 response regulator [Kamptonema animale CS-326]
MAKILVIDDDVTVQIVLQDLLESEGHEVAIAFDGQDGLSQAHHRPPDLIICDWMMPYIDGLEVCRQLKANPELATVFFILLTAREELDDRVKGLDNGADDFLSKPIETEELLARVRAGLRLRGLTQQLERTLQDLQQTQTQLVQSEKMSSLGQLVAGIAHEINNPITFIYSNLSHVQSYGSDLIDLLRLYQKELKNPSPEILQKQQEMELDFVLDDLFKILFSMQTGSERIRQIVLSLQDFSRTDRSGWQPVDVHAGLDNTILMLQHRLPARERRPDIKVIKDYSKMPQVECYAGLLNQAFLNIINNAIDALELSGVDWGLSGEEVKNESEKNHLKPTIKIHTEVLDENRILIIIADNGAGMSEYVKSRIFDPFFTTKPVGDGTGLGLSISYQIVVQQHKGELKCISEPGKGTEIWIEIPIRHC